MSQIIFTVNSYGSITFVLCFTSTFTNQIRAPTTLLKPDKLACVWIVLKNFLKLCLGQHGSLFLESARCFSHPHRATGFCAKMTLWHQVARKPLSLKVEISATKVDFIYFVS